MRRALLLLVASLALAQPAAAADPTALPFGRVILRGYQTAWVIPARGRAVSLPGAEAADWSASLRLFAVTGPGGLTLRTPTGGVNSSRRSAQLVAAPRWSSGRPVRLAFLAGHTMRLLTSDGMHELPLGPARAVAAAWRPGHDELAFVRPGGEVVLMNGNGRLLARRRPPKMPVSLSWTGDARHLVISLRYSVAVLGERLEPQWSLRSPAILSAVAAPAGSLFGLLTVRPSADGSQVTALDLRDAERPGSRVRLARAVVLSGRIVWSPGARYLSVERPLNRDWLLVDVRTRSRRGLEFPRGLRPVFDGLVTWFR